MNSNENETKVKGKIVFGRVGLIRTYTCTCGAGACEADEAGVVCIQAPEYGLNGCGASSGWGEV